MAAEQEAGQRVVWVVRCSGCPWTNVSNSGQSETQSLRAGGGMLGLGLRSSITCGKKGRSQKRAEPEGEEGGRSQRRRAGRLVIREASRFSRRPLHPLSLEGRSSSRAESQRVLRCARGDERKLRPDGLHLLRQKPARPPHRDIREARETASRLVDPTGAEEDRKTPGRSQSPQPLVARALGEAEAKTLLEQVTQERDDAIAKKLAIEAELGICRAKLQASEKQLLEVVEEKLKLLEEIEAWKEDMQELIRQQIQRQLQREGRAPASEPRAPQPGLTTHFSQWQWRWRRTIFSASNSTEDSEP
ncbi:uncharacterized protein LOC123246839 [Gracilinanus agilis]|uniref:uncharacterized protein LOC123246839 n=1 Tax=Gracilinanus agilis TaxID=191870 RepID=UPI001CFCDA7C|nr:uncharacterized protein LOC123246839 [Gracilinanus agilis]